MLIHVDVQMLFRHFQHSSSIWSKGFPKENSRILSENRQICNDFGLKLVEIKSLTIPVETISETKCKDHRFHNL